MCSSESFNTRRVVARDPGKKKSPRETVGLTVGLFAAVLLNYAISE